MHRQFSMANKLPAFVLSACLIFGLFSWIVLYSHATSVSEDTLQEKGELTIGQLVELVRAPLFNNDNISIQVALQKVTEDPSIISASVEDVEGQLIAQSKKSPADKVIANSFSRDIVFQDTLAGKVRLTVNSQPITQRFGQVVRNWLLLWALFSAVCTYLTHRYAEQLSRRLRLMTRRLPGGSEEIIDEIAALETRLQPLLAKGSDEELPETNYYCSLVTATIKNRQRLDSQLNRQNMTLLLEKIDYCTLRTLELYGGKRIEGSNGCINFYIRSTQHSRQHLLVCLMAVYSLQQLLKQLSEQSGIDLEIAWTLCSDNLAAAPLFQYHEGLDRLKGQAAVLAEQLEEGSIGMQSREYDIEQLSSIAHFLPFTEDFYLLQGFPEGRQLLLEKQIQHLASICF
ncbi:MAG: hypothetical protein ACPGF6_06350 [Porticoccaceae bacterium]